MGFGEDRTKQAALLGLRQLRRLSQDVEVLPQDVQTPAIACVHAQFQFVPEIGLAPIGLWDFNLKCECYRLAGVETKLRESSPVFFYGALGPESDDV